MKNSKKYLVLVASYPDNNGNKDLNYVHTRDIEYIRNNMDVTVLNFKATCGYIIDGVKVITISDYKKHQNEFDILVSHAPNLRQHIRFILKNHNNFCTFVFFFHGHEVLRIQKVYPKPYDFKKVNYIKEKILDLYDLLKLYVLRKIFKKFIKKSYFIFVSNWMLDEFEKWVQINREELYNRYNIIYNNVNKIFEEESYDFYSKKIYDYITIRSNLDESKYAIDIVCKLANQNKDKSFLIIGKGDYFKYFKKPENVLLIEKNLNPKEIIEFLNLSKCALMPTRTDAQGVMMCEMATYGIPLITSNIPVCKEVFAEFKNVRYIDNESPQLYDFKFLFNNSKNEKYFSKNTVLEEINIFKNYI